MGQLENSLTPVEENDNDKSQVVVVMVIFSSSVRLRKGTFLSHVSGGRSAVSLLVGGEKGDFIPNKLKSWVDFKTIQP